MTREDACDLIANHEKQMFNITYPTCAGTEVIDKIYDDFENQKCTNCKHCDQIKERLIHCSYFEQYMPIEIGKCDMWKGKDEN